jgi:hypothetical protein
MNNPLTVTPISPLRQRLIDDMNMRRFSPETQRNYIRDVGRFATFLGRAAQLHPRRRALRHVSGARARLAFPCRR